MSSRRYDALATSKGNLESTGLERPQAEAIAQAIGSHGERLATSDDIERLEAGDCDQGGHREARGAVGLRQACSCRSGARPSARRRARRRGRAPAGPKRPWAGAVDRPRCRRHMFTRWAVFAHVIGDHQRRAKTHTGIGTVPSPGSGRVRERMAKLADLLGKACASPSPAERPDREERRSRRACGAGAHRASGGALLVPAGARIDCLVRHRDASRDVHRGRRERDLGAVAVDDLDDAQQHVLLHLMVFRPLPGARVAVDEEVERRRCEGVEVDHQEVVGVDTLVRAQHRLHVGDDGAHRPASA